MLINDWKEFLIPYEQAVEELKVKFKGIRKELIKNKQYSPIEFITGRVKEISSILEKAKKMNMKFENIPDEMEDIAGIRIMCQFVEDIYTVVDLIHKRDGKDLHIVYEKDYVRNKKRKRIQKLSYNYKISRSNSKR